MTEGSPYPAARSVLLLLCLLLLGCGPRVIHGSITGKVYRPDYWWFMPLYMSCGKDCSTFILIPMHQPPAYQVFVEGPDKNGKLSKDSFYVQKADYDLIRAGDAYVCGGDKEAVCPPISRPQERTTAEEARLHGASR